MNGISVVHLDNLKKINAFSRGGLSQPSLAFAVFVHPELHNELLMEDRQGEGSIDLFTRERKNSLKLDAKASGHKVYLGTEEGEMEQYAAKTMLIESGETQTIQSGNDHILTVENSHSLHTEKKQIEHKAKTDIREIGSAPHCPIVPVA